MKTFSDIPSQAEQECKPLLFDLFSNIYIWNS